jgi:6-phosphofructokinase 1
MKKVTKLLVLTSGGDAPGMNAAIRAVVRAGHYYGLQVFGCRSGYQGLIDQDIFPMPPDSVANCIQRGGTILKTARCEEFRKPETRKKCIEFLKEQGIDGMIVIGGDGSFRGATLLNQEGGPPSIGIPGTIDNDINGTEYTIGFDTACNTALQAIDKIRDTASSHDRHFLVEVMGRHAGFLAMDVGIAGGAEMILTPEFPISIESMVEKLKNPGRKKQSTIIVVAEADSNPGRSFKIAEELEKHCQLGFKVCILGHIQRGGSPTVIDRKMASRMGEMAVESLLAGKSNCMTAVQHAAHVLASFPDPSKPSRRLADKELLKISEVLAI